MSTLATLRDAIMATPGFDPATFNADRFAASLPDETVKRLLGQLQAEAEAKKYNKFATLFPDAGPLRRELYQPHMEFFRAGATHRERLLLAANRVGKSVAAAYEITCHLTGRYPHWWEGHRFRKAVRVWAAGSTSITTRDIIQTELFGAGATLDAGKKTVPGTGIIPRETIGAVTWKQGVPDLIDVARIRHVSGQWSQIGLKTYEMGREAFEGTEREVIWLDEEASTEVYGECLIRLATTRGLMMLTFTPLRGITPLVQSFSEDRE